MPNLDGWPRSFRRTLFTDYFSGLGAGQWIRGSPSLRRWIANTRDGSGKIVNPSPHFWRTCLLLTISRSLIGTTTASRSSTHLAMINGFGISLERLRAAQRNRSGLSCGIATNRSPLRCGVALNRTKEGESQILAGGICVSFCVRRFCERYNPQSILVMPLIRCRTAWRTRALLHRRVPSP